MQPSGAVHESCSVLLCACQDIPPCGEPGRKGLVKALSLLSGWPLRCGAFQLLASCLVAGTEQRARSTNHVGGVELHKVLEGAQRLTFFVDHLFVGFVLFLNLKDYWTNNTGDIF